MKFPCVLKNGLLIIRDRFGISFATKGFGYLAALYLPLLLLACYKLSYYQTTYYRQFSACRNYLSENHLSFPSAPRWVRHSLIERTTIYPLYLWVIKTLSSAVAGECSAFGRWNLIRKNLYSVLKFTVTSYYGK